MVLKIILFSFLNLFPANFRKRMKLNPLFSVNRPGFSVNTWKSILYPKDLGKTKIQYQRKNKNGLILIQKFKD